MPTYEYRCPDGHEFTRFYKTISASVSELACPECGKVAARQLSGGAGLVFKGSGFYLTDYGKNAHRGGGPAKSEAGKAEGGKPETGKSDAPSSPSTKGEAKSDAGKSSTESAKPKSDTPKPKAKPE